jgi:hypothetical protein
VAPDLTQLSTRDLLAYWSGVAAELQRRDLIRTNNVVGDLAELIAHLHFGGNRGSFSEPSWDLQTPNGELIQVKGLWKSRASRNKLSAIRDANYDSVLAVVFNADFSAANGYKVGRTAVERMFRHNEHVNGRQITVTRKFIDDPDVETVELSESFAQAVSRDTPSGSGVPPSTGEQFM